MQTFLPYSSFVNSAQVLDRMRLGKQRVEVLQILKALAGESKGWANHPATRMWRGYERALIAYGDFICEEWIARGYKDTCRDKINAYIPILCPEWMAGRTQFPKIVPLPKWVGDEAFHLSHKSNLLRKMPEHYRQFWPDIPDDLEYVWPA